MGARWVNGQGIELDKNGQPTYPNSPNYSPLNFRAWLGSGEKVYPGEQQKFTFTNITPPDEPGEYWLKFDMVQDNKTWFNSQGAKETLVKITVKEITPVACGDALQDCCQAEPKCKTGLECSGSNRCLIIPTKSQKKVGDANGDGAVNLDDLTIWKKEYVAGVGTSADFNNNGGVDLADLTVWKTEYVK